MSGRVRARVRVCPPFGVRLTPLVLQGASGVDNTQRRKWDKGEYAAKAAERQRQEVRSNPTRCIAQASRRPARRARRQRMRSAPKCPPAWASWFARR